MLKARTLDVGWLCSMLKSFQTLIAFSTRSKYPTWLRASFVFCGAIFEFKRKLGRVETRNELHFKKVKLDCDCVSHRKSSVALGNIFYWKIVDAILINSCEMSEKTEKIIL